MSDYEFIDMYGLPWFVGAQSPLPEVNILPVVTNGGLVAVALSTSPRTYYVDVGTAYSTVLGLTKPGEVDISFHPRLEEYGYGSLTDGGFISESGDFYPEQSSEKTWESMRRDYNEFLEMKESPNLSSPEWCLRWLNLHPLLWTSLHETGDFWFTQNLDPYFNLNVTDDGIEASLSHPDLSHRGESNERVSVVGSDISSAVCNLTVRVWDMFDDQGYPSGGFEDARFSG